MMTFQIEVFDEDNNRVVVKLAISGKMAAVSKFHIELVREAGLRAEDAGSLKRARELESLGFLQMTLAVAETVPWTGGFALTN
jgi:predicted dinucleotide-binding enzyme